MRWEDENYVRFYTRDTADWLLLTWQARGLFGLLMRIADRAGIIPLGKAGLRSLAGLLHAPWAEIESALGELLADGCIEHSVSENKLVIPRFVEAQEATRSDRQRQKEKRERDRNHALSRDVTKRDALSRDVDPTEQMSRSVTNLSHSEEGSIGSIGGSGSVLNSEESNLVSSSARDPSAARGGPAPGPAEYHAAQRLREDLAQLRDQTNGRFALTHRKGMGPGAMGAELMGLDSDTWSRLRQIWERVQPSREDITVFAAWLRSGNTAKGWGFAHKPITPRHLFADPGLADGLTLAHAWHAKGQLPPDAAPPESDEPSRDRFKLPPMRETEPNAAQPPTSGGLRYGHH